MKRLYGSYASLSTTLPEVSYAVNAMRLTTLSFTLASYVLIVRAAGPTGPCDYGQVTKDIPTSRATACSKTGPFSGKFLFDCGGGKSVSLLRIFLTASEDFHTP